MSNFTPISTIDKKMKDRIRQIMESQHMTQQVFADYIGQSPATLSSIFNGRTKPTLNIVDAIQRKFPNINLVWLLNGTGDMFVPESTPTTDSPTPEQQSYETHSQRQTSSSPMLDFDAPSAPTPQYVPQSAPVFNSVKSTRSEMERMEVKIIDKPQRRVKEIRVFYDDQTWETFVPEKK